MADMIIIGRETCTIEKVFRIIRFDPGFSLFFDRWTSFAYSLETPYLLVRKIKSDLLLDKNVLEDAVIEILVKWVGDKGSNATLDKLIAALEINELNSCSESIRLEFNLPCKKFEEDPFISWDKIGIPFQQKVIGNLNKFYPDVNCSPILSKLNGGILGDLMIGKIPSLYNSTLPDYPPYYVKRTLSGREGNLTEDQVVELVAGNGDCKPFVVIGDEFGGKTTLLAQLGKKLQLANSDRILIYTEFKTLMGHIKSCSKLGFKDISNALQIIASNNELGRILLDKKINDNGKVEIYLLIDGLQEVKLVPEMLRIISHVSSIRVLITKPSFHNSQTFFDQIVSTHCISLEPLVEASQIELLESYWKIYSSQSQSKLLELAKRCVDEMNSKKTYCLGNPLQCLLTAAAYTETANLMDSSSFYKLGQPKILNLAKGHTNIMEDAARHASFYTLDLILKPITISRYAIEGYNSCNMSRSLYYSINEKDNVDCLLKFKLLIERGATLTNGISGKCGNLLSYAASYASLESLKYIINLNKFNINPTNPSNDVPLFLSVQKAHNVDCLQKLKMLIESGANLDHISKNMNSYNLLHYAARYASLETLNYIISLNKFDINSVDINLNTPLLLSLVGKKNVDCLPKFKLLLSRGANFNHLNNEKYNILLFAARHASVQSFTYVLNLGKFNLNCLDSWGNTPLFLSLVRRNKFDFEPKQHSRGLADNVDCLLKLKLLLERGANPNHLNYNNSNLLHMAALYAPPDELEHVLGITRFNINSQNGDGNTPLLHSVSQYKNIDSLKKLKMLINKGANLNHLNKNNSSLLHETAQCGSLEVFNYVVNLGRFDINSVDREGRSVFHYARNGFYRDGKRDTDLKEKVKLLTQKGCIGREGDRKPNIYHLVTKIMQKYHVA